MRTGYDLREGAQILAERFAKDSAGVQTAPLPLRTSEPWSDKTPQSSLPPAEVFPWPLGRLFLFVCGVWTVLLALVAWVYFSAQWIGLL